MYINYFLTRSREDPLFIKKQARKEMKKQTNLIKLKH